MFSIPLGLKSVISKIPLISSDGNFSLELTSSITAKVFSGISKSLKDWIPLVAISITAS